MPFLRLPRGLAAAVITVAFVACTSDDERGTSRAPSSSHDASMPRTVDGDDDGGAAFDNPTGKPKPRDPLREPGDCVSKGDDVDADGDGYTPNEGDCQDCLVAVNPGVPDLFDNDYDDDCDGTLDEGTESCDDALAIDSPDPEDAARAIGLCKFTTEDIREWGVLSAQWVLADGTPMLLDPLQKGMLPKFGAVVVPREGKRMLALSSGAARAPDQSGFTAACDTFRSRSWDPPEGYPKESPACPGVVTGPVYDPVGLELRIRVPELANSISFNSNFFTYEYPDYICDEYNDFFVVMLDPKPKSLDDANIVFDQDGNPVSVNNSLLQSCAPGTWGGKKFPCPLGPDMLEGTDFEGGMTCPASEKIQGGESNAATGWLATMAPVEGGSIIRVRFTIWDSGDPVLDSLVLVDNFQFSGETPEIMTQPVKPE